MCTHTNTLGNRLNQRDSNMLMDHSKAGFRGRTKGVLKLLTQVAISTRLLPLHHYSYNSVVNFSWWEVRKYKMKSCENAGQAGLDIREDFFFGSTPFSS